jgi:hypothetical protein
MICLYYYYHYVNEPFIDVNEVENKEILKVIDKIFGIYNITYWLNCNMFKSISIIDHDKHKVLYLKNALQDLGYDISGNDNDNNYKIHPIIGYNRDDNKDGVTNNYTRPYVTVHIVGYNENDKTISHVNGIYYDHDIFPLKRYKVDDLVVWVPNYC